MKAQIPGWEANCIICGVSITNPICVNCLEKEIVQWLLTRDQEAIPMVKGITDFFANDVKKTNCIICRAEIGICTCCYINEIYELLLQRDIGLAQELITTFDFDFSFIEAMI